MMNGVLESVDFETSDGPEMAEGSGKFIPKSLTKYNGLGNVIKSGRS